MSCRASFPHSPKIPFFYCHWRCSTCASASHIRCAEWGDILASCAGFPLPVGRQKMILAKDVSSRSCASAHGKHRGGLSFVKFIQELMIRSALPAYSSFNIRICNEWVTYDGRDRKIKICPIERVADFLLSRESIGNRAVQRCRGGRKIAQRQDTEVFKFPTCCLLVAISGSIAQLPKSSD